MTKAFGRLELDLGSVQVEGNAEHGHVVLRRDGDWGKEVVKLTSREAVNVLITLLHMAANDVWGKP